MNHEVTIELKNDISIRGTLKSVDQYLNIKLDDISVVEELKYPHLVGAPFSRREEEPGEGRVRGLGKDRRRKVGRANVSSGRKSSVSQDIECQLKRDYMLTLVGYRARSRMCSFAVAWCAMCICRLRR